MSKKVELMMGFAWLGVLLSMLVLLVGLLQEASAQYANPFQPRPVAQFQPGEEEHCKNHWHADFHILRAWQSENFFWEGQYRLCAELLGFGWTYWFTNPTMEKYEVPMTIIEDHVEEGRYTTFIESCNTHVQHAHITEADFAAETYNAHLNYCHCRATLGLGPCDASFIQQFPYRFVGK